MYWDMAERCPETTHCHPDQIFTGTIAGCRRFSQAKITAKPRPVAYSDACPPRALAHLRFGVAKRGLNKRTDSRGLLAFVPPWKICAHQDNAGVGVPRGPYLIKYFRGAI